MSCDCHKKKLSNTSIDALRVLQDKYAVESAQIIFNLDVNLQNKNTLPDHVDFLESIDSQVKKYAINQYVLDSLDNIINAYLNNKDDSDN
jgi:hypothetical protein